MKGRPSLDDRLNMRLDDETRRKLEEEHRETERAAGVELPLSATARKVLRKGLGIGREGKEGK